MQSNPVICRADLLAALRQPDPWDLIVIGGGATGLGTAVEAATRGYKTLLLERADFAKGTSSRSTKLVHGGVRYLAQGNIGLVRQSLRERGLLCRNAPHLVHDLAFVVPGYALWSQLFYGTGLKVYDALAGRLNLGRSRFLSQQDTLDRLPTLNADGLRGGIEYHDGQFDDARLAIALLRTLLDHGGIALNYCPVTGLIKTGNRLSGVYAQDGETGESFALEGRAIVNATGVFVDAVRQMDEPSASPMLSPSQGIHLVVDRHFLASGLASDRALMIPHTDDGRVLFAVPWHGKVVLGTTDTPVTQICEEPRPLPAEVDFILNTIARYLTQPPTAADVRSVFAGLRPLVKSTVNAAGKSTGKTERGPAGYTAALARDHVIRQSASGLLTITGGKWTTYRQMGEDAVDHVVAIASLPPRPSQTRHLPLHGWTTAPAPAPLTVYGSDAHRLQQLPGIEVPLHDRLPYSEAEVRWAARYELARTVEDLLARRTRALLLDAAASLEAAPRVAALLSEELSHDATWQQQQVEQYRCLAEGYQLNSEAHTTQIYSNGPDKNTEKAK